MKKANLKKPNFKTTPTATKPEKKENKKTITNKYNKISSVKVTTPETTQNRQLQSTILKLNPQPQTLKIRKMMKLKITRTTENHQ